MAENIEADNASWARTAKDLVSGAAGGIAQVLLGMISCYSGQNCPLGILNHLCAKKYQVQASLPRVLDLLNTIPSPCQRRLAQTYVYIPYHGIY